MGNKNRRLLMIVLIVVLMAAIVGCATVQKVKEAAGAVGEVAGAAGKVKEATTPVVVDKHEPNDDLLNPTTIKMNSITKSTIEPAGDIDVYKVHLTSNKREVILVTFLNPVRNLTPHFYYFNQNREEIGDIAGERGAAQVTGQFIAQPNQDYYIMVYSGRWGWSDPDEERSGEYYSLEVKLASVSDEYEPNESLTEAAAISLGEIKGTINPAKDVDCYKIHITEGGTVKVTFVNPTLNLTPHFYYFNQNREEIGDKAGERGAAQVSGQIITQPNQDYYIMVYSGRWGWSDPDEETSTESYTLKIEMVE